MVSHCRESIDDVCVTLFEVEESDAKLTVRMYVSSNGQFLKAQQTASALMVRTLST